jgi:hypothetical protein
MLFIHFQTQQQYRNNSMLRKKYVTFIKINKKIKNIVSTKKNQINKFTLSTKIKLKLNCYETRHIPSAMTTTTSTTILERMVQMHSQKRKGTARTFGYSMTTLFDC